MRVGRFEVNGFEGMQLEIVLEGSGNVCLVCCCVRRARMLHFRT